MTILGVDVGPARLPISSLSSSQMESLRSDLQKLGFFDWIGAA
jgi:N-acetylneuraminate lyase